MRTSLRVRFCSEAFGWWEAQAAMWANKCIEWLPSCSRGLVRSREGLRLAQCRTVTAPQRPRFVARTRANFNAAYGAAVLGRVPRLQSIGLLRAMSTRASPPLSAEARDEGAGGGATSSAGGGWHAEENSIKSLVSVQSPGYAQASHRAAVRVPTDT